LALYWAQALAGQDADACATGLFVAGSNAVIRWSTQEW